MTVLSLTPAGDPLPPAPEDPDTTVTVSRDWDGQHVTYRLVVNGVDYPISAGMLRDLHTTSERLLGDQAEFINRSKEEQHTPAQFGLVLLPKPPRLSNTHYTTEEPDVWIRPDGDSTRDPMMTFEKPEPGWGTDPYRRDGRWVLRLPTMERSEPLDTAHWNDRDKIASLANQAGDPDGCWMLFALTQPQAAAKHERTKAERIEQAAIESRIEANKTVVRDAWSKVARVALLHADTARKVLRAAHLGDGTVAGQPRLMLRSVPLRPSLLRTEVAAEIHGLPLDDSWHMDENVVRNYHSPDSAQYPVCGWELRSLSNARYSQSGPDSDTFLALVEQVRQAVEQARQGTVVERDGTFYWTRHEALFDLALAKQKAMTEGNNAYAHRQFRDVPVPKQQNLSYR